MARTVTAAQLAAIEDEVGTVQFLDVTQYGDREPRFLLTTPDCAYCGSVNPNPRCMRCGAPAPSVTYPAWR